MYITTAVFVYIYQNGSKYSSKYLLRSITFTL